MESGESHRSADELDAARVADLIVQAWQEVDATLGPIIGRGGVVALYGRGVHLTSAVHPWLVPPSDALQTAMDLIALKACLCRQTCGDAVTGGLALMQTFHALLTNLVGSLLAEQLVGPVWARSLSALDAQEALRCMKKS